MSESSQTAPSRPSRQTLLVGLAAVVGLLFVYMLWPAAVKAPAPSNPPREQRKQAAAAGKDSAAIGPLDVRLRALQQPPPAPEEASRNPFRFYVKPPPPPPIPLKFIGTVEVKGRKYAIFTSNDGKGLPVYAAPGDVVLGQYRLVSIGVESATLEYLDGRGRQTIPMRG